MRSKSIFSARSERFGVSVLGCLLFCAFTARADLALTLLPSVKSGLGTNYVAFAGVLTNRNPSGAIFLNSIAVTFNGAAAAYLAADTNAFFGNVPGLLLPGEMYDDVVFGISLSPGLPQTNYSGTVTIRGGSDIFGATDLLSQSFQLVFRPTLALIPSGPNLVLSWPASGQNFSLQQIPELRSSNWTSVTNNPTVVNGQNQVTLPAPASTRFFRLKYP